MAGNAFIGVEVVCGTKAPGLDGSTDAIFVFSFVFPDGESAEFEIPVVAKGNKKKKPGEKKAPDGDTAVDIVNKAKAAVQKAVKDGKLSAKNAAHIGFETKTVDKGKAGGRARGGGGGGGGVGGVGGRRGGGADTKDYLGRISFWQVDSIDAACTNGKVRSKAFTNDNPPAGSGMPGLGGDDDGVEIKQPPKAPPKKKWEDKIDKSSTQDSEWEKFVESGGWTPPGFGHYNVRLPDTDSGSGIFGPGDGDEFGGRMLRIPFEYVHSSPQAQVEEITRRLLVAGFECAKGDTWVRPLVHIPTGLPVVGYGIETAEDPYDFYGPFPWKMILGKLRTTAPVSVLNRVGPRVPRIEPVIPTRTPLVVDSEERDGAVHSSRARPVVSDGATPGEADRIGPPDPILRPIE